MNKNDLTLIQLFTGTSARVYALDILNIDNVSNKIYKLVNNIGNNTPYLLYNQKAYSRHMLMYYMECNGTTYYMEANPELYLLKLNGTSLNDIKTAMSDS